LEKREEAREGDEKSAQEISRGREKWDRETGVKDRKREITEGGKTKGSPCRNLWRLHLPHLHHPSQKNQRNQKNHKNQRLRSSMMQQSIASLT
jgi:hypothetical protein